MDSLVSSTARYNHVECRHLRPSIRRFSSIEELDELPRELGWPLEYRQIEPGAFSSTFHDVEGDTWFMMEEQSNRTVEIEAGSPSGMYLLAVVEGGAPSCVDGQLLTSDCVLVQSPNSDFRATLQAGTRGTQLGLVAEHFERLIQHVAPDIEIPERGIALFATKPGTLGSIRSAMRSAIFAPSVRESLRSEAVSRIASGLALATAMHDTAPLRRRLSRANARQALRKARNYIEEHVGDELLIESMCRYAGTTLRTLERTFTRELGLTPQQYVKVRRLNAVRRCLRAAKADSGVRVTDVALDNGFAHLSRFASEYRRHFGEYPRDTLAGQ